MIGTAPIERVDVFHGKAVVQSARPFASSDLGQRIRVLWQGAEYRGRGRETIWRGKPAVDGNRIARFEPVNFLNPERTVAGDRLPVSALAWTSVTTGNLAGIDLWLERAQAGTLRVETNIVSGRGRSRQTSPTTPSCSTAAALAASSASIACRKPTGAAADADA